VPQLTPTFLKPSRAGQINSLHRDQAMDAKGEDFKRASANRDLVSRQAQLTPASQKKLAGCGIVLM
jgi:hypothetical protein